MLFRSQCYVVGVNRVGDDGNDFAYSGHSMFIDSQGEILTEIENEEKTEIVTLKEETLTFTRRHMPFLNDRDEFTIGIRNQESGIRNQDSGISKDV